MSAAPNLVTGPLPACRHWPWYDEDFPGCHHIYLYDRETGNTELISVSDDGTPGSRASQDGDVSADGRWVIFTSLAVNLTADAPSACRDYAGFCPQVFVRDRDKDRTFLVSAGWDGRVAEASSYEPVITAGGRYVAFASRASNLAPNVPPDQLERVFVTDLVVERILIAPGAAASDTVSPPNHSSVSIVGARLTRLTHRGRIAGPSSLENHPNARALGCRAVKLGVKEHRSTCVPAIR